MRILYDHQAFAIQRFGGLSRYFYELSNGIAAGREAEAEVLAPLYTCEYFTASSAIRPRGLRIPARGTRVLRRLVNPGVSWMLSRRRRDVDVFHETYYSRLDSKPRSALRVLTVLDMIHERFPHEFADSELMRSRKLAAIRRADHVICISEATRADLLQFFEVDPDRVSVVHLGHGLVSTGAEKALPPGDDDRPYFLYVGLRAGYKNFDAFLLAFSRSGLAGDYSIVCFGGPPLTAAELERARALGLRSGALRQVTGDDAGLARYYSSATALVYPSLYEGFGIPPLEAMALGCPVICSDRGSMKEVVGDAAELFDPTDVAAVGAALERVAGSPEVAAAMVARGRLQCVRFTWEKCVADTLSVYRDLVAG